MSGLYSIGAMNQLADALESAEFSAEEITLLRQYGDLGKIKGMLRVPAEIVAKKLLEQRLGTVPIPATTTPFVVADHFRLIMDGGICSFLGSNFESWFLPKVEEPAGSVVLRYHELRRNSLDGPIIADLGGEKVVVTPLAHIFALMKRQDKKGRKGPLLTTGAANIFYALDAKGVLRALVVFWSDGGWFVSAYSVGYPRGWDGGGQVFSPANS